MELGKHIADQVRSAYFGGNYTGVPLKDTLADVSWQEAIARVDDLNTIAALVYHMNYYLRAVARVLDGGPLDARDQFSFDLPPVRSAQDWDRLRTRTFEEARALADQLEALPEDRWTETFVEERYGSVLRNVLGVVEHMHYHLGQIVLMKKWLGREGNNRA